MVKDQICKAFCNGIVIKDVPMGNAIVTSAKWLSGDEIVFYARHKGNLVRFEDSGSTVFDLETNNVDMSSSSRQAIMQSLCDEYDIIYDEDEIEFRSDWVNKAQAGFVAIRFFYFLLRMQDLLFTTRERISNTFKDDLISEIKREFSNEAIVTFDTSPIGLDYYTVDIVVTSKKTGRTAAIFPGNSEQKALEAILFSKELELNMIENISPFLLLENTGSKISRKTRSKALNSELLLADWQQKSGREAIDKIRKRIDLPISA